MGQENWLDFLEFPKPKKGSTPSPDPAKETQQNQPKTINKTSKQHAKKTNTNKTTQH